MLPNSRWHDRLGLARGTAFPELPPSPFNRCAKDYRIRLWFLGPPREPHLLSHARRATALC